jgi:hypothetical protein
MEGNRTSFIGYLNMYKCPNCNHKWAEVYDCIPNSQCSKCDKKDIEVYLSNDIIF